MTNPRIPPPRRLNPEARAAIVEGAPTARYDLAVIGGGITGAGIARDAAMRGLKVVLLEQSDLGSGTSSRSSKLVHGGLRYLEHLEFKLVFEATHERAALMRIAPHLVRPLPFLFPVYRRDKESLRILDAGMWVYDALSRFSAPRLHRTYRSTGTLSRESLLRPDGLQGSGVYYDAGTDDTRLTLATALDAFERGADLLTYTQATAFTRTANGLNGVIARDRRSGRELELRARAVVNATGPWSDRTRRMSGRPAAATLRPTKGVHLVLPYDRLPVHHAVVLRGLHDRRVLFAIPWGLHTYVGTTDTDYEGDPAEVRADPADAAYLMEVLQWYFPGAHLRIEDCVSSWAGLRPLIQEEAAAASDVSREHHLSVDDDGLITIAGGKLTTYRRMAAQVVDAVARALAGSPSGLGPSQTDDAPLPGGGPPDAAAERELEEVLPADQRQQLRDVHGSRWVDVARRAGQDGGLATALCPGLPYLRAEVAHSVEAEGALSVNDVLSRRTQVLLRAAEAIPTVAPEVARLMAPLLGWSERERDESTRECLSQAAAALAFRGASPRVPGDPRGTSAGAPPDSDDTRGPA